MSPEFPDDNLSSSLSAHINSLCLSDKLVARAMHAYFEAEDEFLCLNFMSREWQYGSGHKMSTVDVALSCLSCPAARCTQYFHCVFPGAKKFVHLQPQCKLCNQIYFYSLTFYVRKQRCRTTVNGCVCCNFTHIMQILILHFCVWREYSDISLC